MNYELELCINDKCEISEVDHYTYTWIFSSSIFRLTSEITFYLTSFFLTNGLGFTLAKKKT